MDCEKKKKEKNVLDSTKKYATVSLKAVAVTHCLVRSAEEVACGRLGAFVSPRVASRQL
jgi:hypothetical protein